MSSLRIIPEGLAMDFQLREEEVCTAKKPKMKQSHYISKEMLGLKENLAPKQEGKNYGSSVRIEKNQ